MGPVLSLPVLNPAPLTPGTLYLVATPIGNMEDITLRAIRTLRDCDLVAAEDTRHTGILLKRLCLAKRQVSIHKFNEAKRAGEIISMLEQGGTVALVSDAGSPGISDPGQRAKRLAKLLELPGTLALYESPYRITKLLGELAELAPAREVVLARELTKKFEQIQRGTAAQLLEYYREKKPKGEYVVLVGQALGSASEHASNEMD